MSVLLYLRLMNTVSSIPGYLSCFLCFYFELRKINLYFHPPSNERNCSTLRLTGQGSPVTGLDTQNSLEHKAVQRGGRNWKVTFLHRQGLETQQMTVLMVVMCLDKRKKKEVSVSVFNFRDRPKPRNPGLFGRLFFWQSNFGLIHIPPRFLLKICFKCLLWHLLKKA